MTKKLKWKVFKDKKPKLGARVLLRRGYIAQLDDSGDWELDAVTHGEIFPALDSDKWVSFSELVKFLDRQ